MNTLTGLSQPLALRLEKSPLLQRWRALAPRERLALSVLALFLLAALLYLGLWRPAEQSRAVARSYFEQQRELHAYLEAQAPLARGLQGKPKVSVDPARLQGLVTAAAVQQGLTVERLDSEGDGGLQVSLQPAPFAQLLRWFGVLESQGVRIGEAGLDRNADGRVAARLTLHAGP
ncbi:type II secretion system protein M [Pseudomonas cavernae]|uniref:Type II secretion system protein M n=1 Tax=Pseudomonas cavernae TaxID=2320867 RepID=A0A385Z2L9_9PSED|nr:type II secretion system protein M [Pseudomonas cavernae]AYC33509.1 type II secretion system protein M [Pseudomonas cavernae]